MILADRNLEDHRNRFIRFRLYSGMRFLLGFVLALIPLQAMSLKDFVIIDFVVGEESVSGFAFGFLTIASGWDTEAGFAGKASED